MPKSVKPPVITKINLTGIEINEPINKVDVFQKFCLHDINSAVKELEGLKVERNRKHLQKLVYMNLVNQFDYLLDKLLLWFSINSPKFREQILKDLDKETISKKEVFELFFMKDKSYEIIVEKIQNETRSKTLRDRHSKKLLQILNILNFKNIEQPRVNNSTGHILKKIKKHSSIPNSILGYADWLYSRRNSIVHGVGNKFSKQDYDHIVSMYKVKLSKDFKLYLSSIKTAVNFYSDLLSDISKRIQDQEHLKIS